MSMPRYYKILTPQVMGVIAQTLAGGSHRRVAAARVGISAEMFNEWFELGRKAKYGKIREFFVAVEKAEADAEARNVLIIQKAAQKFWQASAWYLEPQASPWIGQGHPARKNMSERPQASKYLLKLTPRWSKLRPHPEQSRLFHQAIRFKIVPAGRRSGKTELAKRKLVLSLWEALIQKRADARYFAAAPTRHQAKRIWWDDLKALTPAAWLDAPPRETELRIRTQWGAELWVIGLDRPQRIEGTPWDGCVIDEIADCKPGTWDAHIRPALADRGGWAWLTGVPDRDAPGQVEYKRMHDHAAGGTDPEWRAYHWPSSDILPAAEVQAMRRSMDDEMFRQELGGQFVLAGGLAFPDFDARCGGLHVNESAVYDPALPLCWSLDFNVNPMCSGVIQRPVDADEPFRVIHEFTLADSSTDVACDAFLEWCERRGIVPHDVRIYGDPTGNARDSTSGLSDWAIIRRRMRAYNAVIRVPKAPWPVKDTVNCTRARIKSAAGRVGLVIHPGCRRLVRDLQEALWPGDLMQQHCLAWLRYFAVWEYPIRGAELPAAGRLVIA